MFYCLLRYSTLTSFGGFNNPYPGQKRSYCPMSNFELVIPRGVFFRGISKHWTNASFGPWGIIAMTAGFPTLRFRFVPLNNIS